VDGIGVSGIRAAEWLGRWSRHQGGWVVGTSGCRGIWASGRWVAGQMELVVVRWVAYGEASGCPGIGAVEWLVRWNAASGQLGGWASGQLSGSRGWTDGSARGRGQGEGSRGENNPIPEGRGFKQGRLVTRCKQFRYKLIYLFHG